jgi:hypothetical protein
MAFGIDDALEAAAAGLKLSNTLVEIVNANRKEKDSNSDLELLIEEVRITALQRINEADLSLKQLDDLLHDKGVDQNKTLSEVINKTSWFRWYEAHRLKRIRRSFNSLADAAYESCDDVAALVRCRDRTGTTGTAVAIASTSKHAFNSALLSAKSVKDAIALLRAELDRQKKALS